MKRATVPGAPYTTIASLNTFSINDITVLPSITYYYVVSQVNAPGEGPNSAQIDEPGITPSDVDLR